MNCRHYGVWLGSGRCFFLGDNKYKRLPYSGSKENDYFIEKVDGEIIKHTYKLDYCTEFKWHRNIIEQSSVSEISPLKEAPSRSLTSFKEQISILKDGKISKAIITKEEMSFEGKLYELGKGGYESWNIEGLTGGKIIGCINCKYWDGDCLFSGDNSKVFFPFGDTTRTIWRHTQDHEPYKFTESLDYCKEFDLEEDK